MLKFFFIFLFSTQALMANEIQNISVITPVSYSTSSGKGKDIKSAIKADIAGYFNVDIAKRVREKIDPYANDLSPYFASKNEFNNFVNQVINSGVNQHLKEVNDDNLIKFYGHLGNNLIGKFADRILNAEGVKSSARRDLWVAKLTAPFNSCINNSSNSQYDANQCIEALTGSLVPSIGVAIVYEMSVANLNGSLEASERAPFNAERVNQYKACLPTNNVTTDAVMKCALNSMRTGIQKVTDKSLTKTIEKTASSGLVAKTIKAQVWPDFNACSNRVGSNPKVKADLTAEFTKCIDNLVISTGAKLVEDKISTTPSIKEALGSKQATQLSLSKAKDFQECALLQMKNNKRASGMLDVSPCENKITNEVTYLVVSDTFKKTATDSFKDNKKQASQIGNEGVKLLSSCWSNSQSSQKREDCLKNSIIKFSQNIAGAKLELAIPKEMDTRAKLKSTAVSSLASCLNKELPKNISQASDLNSRIEKCSGEVTKYVALNVAEYQVRDTAKENLDKKEVNKLVAEHVKGTFANCIGKNPSDSSLEKCGDLLTSKAAIEITGKSFDKEVNAYLQKAGGTKALGITQNDVNQFIKKLTSENTACVNKKSSAETMDKVNSCVKDSIKKIAFFFGEAQFNQSTNEIYKNRKKDKETIAKSFKSSLDKCLSQKDSKKFTIEDYTQNLYKCAENVSGTTTRTVVLDQINHSINDYIKDRPNLNNESTRESLRNILATSFDNCARSNAKDINKCVDEIKKEATTSIVLNYGRIETQAQLTTQALPKELKPVEEQFMACTKTDKQGDELAKYLDECTKSFALNFAKALGTLKLNYLLNQALGTTDYNKNKPIINNAITKYEACLNNLKQYSMSDGFTEKLSVCTDALTSQGMGIVSSNVSSWMTSEDKDLATQKIKQDFANFLPCLSALLPSSPYTPKLEGNVDSILKPVALLLAQYIEYNPENAKQTLSSIINNLSVDLNDVSSTQKAKADLLDLIYKNGGLDQFLKAVIRGTVIDGLKAVSLDDIPKEVRDILLSKNNFEKIFNSPDGSKIKEQIMSDVLRPGLLEGKDLASPEMTAKMDQIKSNVVEVLINAPSFGEEIIKKGIQVQINQLGGVTKFFAKTLYGDSSLDWEKVRQTPNGKKAEEYIKEKVIIPKFKGQTISEEEMKKITAEAKALVTKGVKGYAKSK